MLTISASFENEVGCRDAARNYADCAMSFTAILLEYGDGTSTACMGEPISKRIGDDA